jgi:hypothetical protein
MSSGTAATPAASAPPPTMKLVVDAGAERVLFAEAGKDVVDFIFGVLAMPLGAADRLLVGRGGELGSIASAERMDAAACVQSAAARDALLLMVDPAAPPRHSHAPSAAAELSLSEPALSSPFAPAVPPLFEDNPTAPLFSAATAGFPFAGMPEPPQPPAPSTTSIKLSRPGPNRALPLYLNLCDACRAARLSKGSGGFVKDLATPYTVTDDLTVTPTMSSASTLALLKRLGVKDLDALEERTVSIGQEEVKIDPRSRASFTSLC